MRNIGMFSKSLRHALLARCTAGTSCGTSSAPNILASSGLANFLALVRARPCTNPIADILSDRIIAIRAYNLIIAVFPPTQSVVTSQSHRVEFLDDPVD